MHICSVPTRSHPRDGENWHCTECGQNWRYQKYRGIWVMVPAKR